MDRLKEYCGLLGQSTKGEWSQEARSVEIIQRFDNTPFKLVLRPFLSVKSPFSGLRCSRYAQKPSFSRWAPPLAQSLARTPRGAQKAYSYR